MNYSKEQLKAQYFKEQQEKYISEMMNQQSNSPPQPDSEVRSSFRDKFNTIKAQRDPEMERQLRLKKREQERKMRQQGYNASAYDQPSQQKNNLQIQQQQNFQQQKQDFQYLQQNIFPQSAQNKQQPPKQPLRERPQSNYLQSQQQKYHKQRSDIFSRGKMQSQQQTRQSKFQKQQQYRQALQDQIQLRNQKYQKSRNNKKSQYQQRLTQQNAAFPWESGQQQQSRPGSQQHQMQQNPTQMNPPVNITPEKKNKAEEIFQELMRAKQKQNNVQLTESFVNQGQYQQPQQQMPQSQPNYHQSQQQQQQLPQQSQPNYHQQQQQIPQQQQQPQPNYHQQQQQQQLPPQTQQFQNQTNSNFRRDLMSQINNSRQLEQQQMPPRPQSTNPQQTTTQKNEPSYFSKLAEMDKQRQLNKKKKKRLLAEQLRQQMEQQKAKKKKEKEMLEKLQQQDEERFHKQLKQQGKRLQELKLKKKMSKQFIREFYGQDVQDDVQGDGGDGGNQQQQQEQQQQFQQQPQQNQSYQQPIQQPINQPLQQTQPPQQQMSQQNFHQGQQPPTWNIQPPQQPQQNINSGLPPKPLPYSQPSNNTLSDELYQKQLYETQLRIQQQQQEIELKRKEAAMKLAFQQEQQLLQQKALEEQQMIKGYRDQVSNLINEKEGFQSEIQQLKTMINQMLSKQQTLHLQQQVNNAQFQSPMTSPTQQPFPTSGQQFFPNQQTQQIQNNQFNLPGPQYTQQNFNMMNTGMQQAPQNEQITKEKLLQYLALLGDGILTNNNQAPQQTQPQLQTQQTQQTFQSQLQTQQTFQSQQTQQQTQSPPLPSQPPQNNQNPPINMEESGILLQTHKGPIQPPKLENLEKLRQSLSGTSKLVFLNHGKDLLDKTYQKDLDILQILYEEKQSQDPLSEQRATQIRWQKRQNEVIEEEESNRDFDEDQGEGQDGNQYGIQQSQLIQQQEVNDQELAEQYGQNGKSQFQQSPHLKNSNIAQNQNDNENENSDLHHIHNETSETIELNDFPQDEIQKGFREQTLYEVMKSHLIPEDKMQQLDQNQPDFIDEVEEPSQTQNFTKDDEAEDEHEDTIKPLKNDENPDEEDQKLPITTNREHNETNDIQNEINAYLQAEKNLIESGRHTSQGFMTQEEREEIYQSKLMTIRKSNLRSKELKQSPPQEVGQSGLRLQNESKLSQMNPMLMNQSNTMQFTQQSRQDRKTESNQKEMIIEEDIEENITGIMQSQEKENIWENEEEQNSFEVDNDQLEEKPNLWLQQDPQSRGVTPQNDFNLSQNQSDYSNDVKFQNQSYDEDFEDFESSVKKSSKKKQQKPTPQHFNFDLTNTNNPQNDSEGLKNFNEQIKQLELQKADSKQTIGDLSLKQGEMNSKEIEDFLLSNTDGQMLNAALLNNLKGMTDDNDQADHNEDIPKPQTQILEESKEFIEQAQHYTDVKRRNQKFLTSLQPQSSNRRSRQQMFNSNYPRQVSGNLSQMKNSQRRKKRFKKPKVLDPFSRGGSRSDLRKKSRPQTTKQYGARQPVQMIRPETMNDHQEQLISQQMMLDKLDNLLEEIEDNRQNSDEKILPPDAFQNQETVNNNKHRQSQPIQQNQYYKERENQNANQPQYQSLQFDNIDTNNKLFRPLSKQRQYSNRYLNEQINTSQGN